LNKPSSANDKLSFRGVSNIVADRINKLLKGSSIAFPDRRITVNAYISALIGLAGVAIGSLTSFATTWITQQAQAILYALVAQMRLFSSRPVVDAAELVTSHATARSQKLPNLRAPVQ
jgi:hypothetical protein